MPSYWCSSSDFLQSHYTVLMTSFFVVFFPFSCTSGVLLNQFCSNLWPKETTSEGALRTLSTGMESNNTHNSLFFSSSSIDVWSSVFGDVAQLVKRRTGTLLTQVRFPSAARDSSAKANFQCRLSYGVRTPPCAIACINTNSVDYGNTETSEHAP